MSVAWNCLECGAEPHKHGKGGKDACKARAGLCDGFTCECDDDDIEHGTSLANPCLNAVCSHCGWAGTFPVMPKKLLAWEKKALVAGWVPPETRKKELGL